MPTATLRRAGGSVMVTVPPMYLKDNDLSVGQLVSVEVSGETLTIKPATKKRITLQEIIAGTPKKVAAVRARGWDEMPAAGNER